MVMCSLDFSFCLIYSTPSAKEASNMLTGNHRQKTKKQTKETCILYPENQERVSLARQKMFRQ